MPCQQIRHLHNLLAKHDLQPSSSDLLAIVCGSCDNPEVCPAPGQGPELANILAFQSAPIRTPVVQQSTDGAPSA